MQKVERGLLSPSSRASSVVGDDNIASDNLAKVRRRRLMDNSITLRFISRLLRFTSFLLLWLFYNRFSHSLKLKAPC